MFSVFVCCFVGLTVGLLYNSSENMFCLHDVYTFEFFFEKNNLFM